MITEIITWSEFLNKGQTTAEQRVMSESGNESRRAKL